MPDESPKVYGYCRLSKKELVHVCEECGNEFHLKVTDIKQTTFACSYCQAEQEVDVVINSIQSQIDIITRKAETELPRKVDPNIKWHCEVLTAEVPFRDRPAGAEVFNQIRSGDYLVIAKLDRGFRDLVDFCNQLEFFEQTNINLIMCDLPIDLSSAAGRMVAKVLALFAQFERERISERTKEGLARNKKSGKPQNGAIPRGFKLKCTNCGSVYPHNSGGRSCAHCKVRRVGNGEYIPCPHEQQIMWRLLWDRSPFNYKDWFHCAHDLAEEGYRTRKGKKIGVTYVRTYWEDAVELFAKGQLLEEHRPPKMENFRLDHIIKLPKKVRDMLDEERKKKDEKDAA